MFFEGRTLVFETILSALLGVAALVAFVGWMLRQPIRRAWRYLELWRQRDQRAEEEALRDRVLREQARKEIEQDCGLTSEEHEKV